ncbi:MAG: hypothetical protein KBS76_07045 [Ruminococcus sp.]|nr:hypothetical protein [Candidatus Apopatosoma intestinale]
MVVSAGNIDSGFCGAQGDNVTWTLDEEGTLTISGTAVSVVSAGKDNITR